MNEKIINGLVRFRSWSFIQILQRTMLALFPLALIGSFGWVLSRSFLSDHSFLGQLTNIKAWFPNYQSFSGVINDISMATNGVLAVYAAFISAIVTARRYHMHSVIVGPASAASYFLIFIYAAKNGESIEFSFYSAYWFIIGIFVGYIVGLIFVKLGKNNPVDSARRNDILADVFANFVPLLIVLVIALVIHLSFLAFRHYQMDKIISQSVNSIANQHSSYPLSILITFLSTISLWFGFTGRLNFSSGIFDNEAVANLSYALAHKNPWNIPYPFTMRSLFSGFGQIGGVGGTLALVIALVLISRNKQQRKVAASSSIPTFFNINIPIALGTPAMWNPIYLIPFVIAPIVNMIVGSIGIYLKIFPSLVYPVPEGTPGILGPFMSTGGNVYALIWTILILVIDVLIYLPFVSLDNKVSKRYEEVIAHEKIE